MCSKEKLNMNNIAPANENPTEFSSADETSLLVIILDTNPGQRILRENPHVLTQCVDSVIAFANSHLMQKAQNKLAMMACHSKSRFVRYRICKTFHLPFYVLVNSFILVQTNL